MPKSSVKNAMREKKEIVGLEDEVERGGVPQSEYILSLERGFAVIKCFDEQNPRRTLSEVAKATGLSRGAARRFLITLKALGYVEATDRYFSLRPRTLELGYAYLASIPWWRNAQRVVDRVSTDLGNTCAIGVLDGDWVVYVAYASEARFSTFSRSVSTKIPAFSTAIGRVILASLPEPEREKFLASVEFPRLTAHTVRDVKSLRVILEEVRMQGHALVDQELSLGLASVGVPILDRGGHILAGMSISYMVPGGPKPNEIRSKILKTLKQASLEISDMLPA